MTSLIFKLFFNPPVFTEVSLPGQEGKWWYMGMLGVSTLHLFLLFNYYIYMCAVIVYTQIVFYPLYPIGRV